MYRLQLASGEAAVFRTIEELTLAVQSGTVSPWTLVYDRLTNSWRPLSEHPDYQVACPKPVEAPAPEPEAAPTLAAEPEPTALAEPEPASPAEPLPALLQPEELVLPVLAARATPVESSAERPRAPLPPASRTRKLRAMLALSLLVVAVSAFGIWRWTDSREPKSVAAAASDSLQTPAAAVTIDSVILPAPTIQEPPIAASVPPASQSSAPKVGAMQQQSLAAAAPPKATSAADMLRSYRAAYLEARAEMDSELTYVNAARFFAASRLGSADSLRAARRMVAATSNIVREYHNHELMIDQSFRGTGGDEVGSDRENFETAQASAGLLADVDSVYGLLLAGQGRFTLTGGRISFSDPELAVAYTKLFDRITATAATWADSAETANRVTVPRVLKALGEAPPLH